MLPISWTDWFVDVNSKQDHPGPTFNPYTDLQSRTEIIHVNLLRVNQLVYDVLWKEEMVKQKDKKKNMTNERNTRNKTVSKQAMFL